MSDHKGNEEYPNPFGGSGKTQAAEKAQPENNGTANDGAKARAKRVKKVAASPDFGDERLVCRKKPVYVEPHVYEEFKRYVKCCMEFAGSANEQEIEAKLVRRAFFKQMRHDSFYQDWLVKNKAPSGQAK